MDLLVLIILVRTCYSGYDRGLLAEILHLAGVVTVTALTINFSGAATAWVQAMMAWQPPGALPLVVFWLLFLALLGVKQLLVKSLTSVMKWERLHWLIQGFGIAFGALRGLWWSGLVLMTLAGSGLPYLQQSVEERALLGASLLPLARAVITASADAFPGAEGRGAVLLPPFHHAS